MFVLLIELFFSFFKVGIFGFGGGYAMLALLEHEIVRSQGWMNVSELVDVIAVAEMTPGPVAINAATFVGYQVAGLYGAITATVGVVFPSLLIIVPATKIIMQNYSSSRLHDILEGIRPSVIALIGLAAFVIGGSSIVDWKSALLTAGSLPLLFFTRLSPLTLIGLGAIAGILIYM